MRNLQSKRTVSYALRYSMRLVLGAGLVACSCSDPRDDCYWTTTCPAAGADGGTAGAGGTSSGGAAGGRSGGAGAATSTGGLVDAGGSAGTPAGGSAGAGEGGQGGAAGEAGGGAGGEAGSAGGALPCDGACSGATPACNLDTHTCVECTSKSDCVAPKAACDPSTNRCVACVANADCKGATPVCDPVTNTCAACLQNTDCKGPTPLCDLTTQTCVACLEQKDCTGPTASRCDLSDHACKPCATDAQCSDIAGKGVCFGGECVQCTGKKAAACGSDQGTPLVCDSLEHTCTTAKVRSADLCQPCVSDAQCLLGELCLLDTLGTGATAKSVGYFCHWKKGDVANGAPADCLATGRPYAGTRSNVTSIDGETADICVLRTSTCLANNEFSSKNCAPSGTPSDALCGFSPPDDAKCIQGAESSTYRCTMTCLSDDDCPSPTVCNTARRVCIF